MTFRSDAARRKSAGRLSLDPFARVRGTILSLVVR